MSDLKITWKDYFAFAGQFAFQSAAKLTLTLIGLIVVPIGLCFTTYPKEHPFYDYVKTKHRKKYIDMGSSGEWVYEMLPDWWIMKPYRNLNYGLRGEPSGRFSALHDGKEDKWYIKFVQAATRNPSNGMRYMDRFSCQVDNCDIVYKGDYGPLELKDNPVYGWNFVKGIDRDTGKCYYGFQWIKEWNEKYAGRIRVGFKIEPSHIDRGDLAPSRERATHTLRFSPYKTKDPYD